MKVFRYPSPGPPGQVLKRAPAGRGSIKVRGEPSGKEDPP